MSSSPKDNRIDYFSFHMTCIVLFSAILVIDRFTSNVWPMWVDSPGPIIEDNFSVTCFALIAWISSRLLLVSSSYIFLFECRVFWNWFVETIYDRTRENKYLNLNHYLRIGDIHQTNNRLHYHIGWALVGVPVMAHVWIIVVAMLAKPNTFVIYNEWMRPNDPSTGNSIPFYSNHLLSLGINDIYRLVSTTLTFAILIPYSIIAYFRDQNWSFAQWIHLFGACVYTIDLLRMTSHPHCWILNAPFVCLWLCDRVYGILAYRTCIANLIGKIHLDNGCMILFFRIPHSLHSLHSIGDVYYFNTLDRNGMDRAHPFTVFQNHKSKNRMISVKKELIPSWTGHKFKVYKNSELEKEQSITEYIVSRQTTKIEESISVPMHECVSESDIRVCGNEENEEINKLFEDNCDWNIGVIMQIIPNHSGAKCSHKRQTWTKALFDTNYKLLAGLRAWGPYRSEYRLLFNECIANPLVLIGTGAGCALLIDYYNFISAHQIKLAHKIEFYFSTKSIAMFQWFTDVTCHKKINNLFVNAHITSHSNLIQKQKNKIDIHCSDTDTDALNNESHKRDMKIGRLCLNEILESAAKDTHVYFCGHPNVQQIAHTICKKQSLQFHAGHSF